MNETQTPDDWRRLDNLAGPTAERERVQVTLPPALAKRVIAVVADEALGYRDIDDFHLSAVSNELERAERTRFHLGRGGP